MRTIALKLLIFILLLCSCSVAKKSIELSSEAFSVDLTLRIRYINNMKIVGDLLYITYEYPRGYGDNVLCSYFIDYENMELKFNKIPFENGTHDNLYYLISFWDNEDNLLVVDRNNPVIFEVSSDSLHRTSKSIISAKAKTPHPMAIEVAQVFYKAPDEYYFIGRSASQIQTVYHSDNRTDSLIVSEMKPIIYDESYPSWIVNYGTFAYNYQKEMGVWGYKMFPAIMIYDFVNKTDKVIEFGEQTFDPSTISKADIWENNPVHFRSVSTTNDYIYALYWGEFYSEMDKKESAGTVESKIIKFDWKGKVKKIYTVNKKIRNFTIDDNERIIAHDGKEFLLIEL